MSFFVKLLIFLLIIGAFFGYLFFQLNKNFKSAAIEIFEPQDANFQSREIKIKGRVRNISFLEINGRPVVLQSDGNFEEDLLLSEGLNNIEIKGKNKFGKEIIKKMILNVNLSG